MNIGTDQKRDVYAAFWGGLIGMLAFGYIFVYMAPGVARAFYATLGAIVGASTGSFVGWRHREILKVVRRSYFRARTRGRLIAVFIRDAIYKPRYLWKNRPRKELSIPNPLRWIHTAACWLLIAFLATIGSPLTFWRAYNTNTVLRAAIMTCLAGLTCFASFAIGIAFLTSSWVRTVPVKMGMAKMHDVKVMLDTSGQHVGLVIFSFAAFFLCFFMTISVLKSRDHKQLAHEYRSRSQLGYFAVEVGRIGWMCILALSILVLSVAYYTLAAFACLLLLWAPVSFVAYTLRGVYRVSRIPGHQLCVGTTVGTTLVSALAFHLYLSGHASIWAISALTGVGSSCAVLTLRAVMEGVIEERLRRTIFASPKLNKHLQRVWRSYWKRVRTGYSVSWTAVQTVAPARLTPEDL